MPRRYQRIYHCPFFERRIPRGVRCEGREIILPDDRAAIDLTRTYCGNEVNWRSCSIARTLEKFYEREGDMNGQSPENT